MFGGILSRLLGNSADDVAAKVASKAATNYGDDVARAAVNAATNASGSTLSKIGNQVANSGNNSIFNRILSKAGDILDDAGNTALNSGRSVTRKGMREAGKGAKNNIASIYRRTGISDPAKQAEFGLSLTGGKDSVWDNITNNLRKNPDVLNNVDLSGDVADNIGSIVSSFPKSIQGRIDMKNPEEMSRIFKSEGNRLLRSASPTTGQTELAKMMLDTGNYIDNAIDDAVVNYSPDAIQNAYKSYADEARRLAGQARIDGNTQFMKAYDKLAKEVEAIPESERSLQNLRSLKADFVTSNKLEKLSDQAQGGGSLTNAIRGGGLLPKGIANTIDAAVGVPAQAATNKIGAGLIKSADALRNPATQDTIKKVAMAGGGLAALSALNGSNSDNTSATTGLSGISEMPTSMTGLGGLSESPAELNGGSNTTDSASAQGGSGDTIAGYSRGDLENAYVAALMDDNTDAAKAISTMIDILNDNYSRTEDASTTKVDTKKANALNQMNTLMGLYQQAGGGQGIGGHLTNLLNTVTFGNANPAANAYQSQRTAAAVALARAGGDTGALSNQDIQSYMSMLPSVTDSGQAAQLKIQAIYNMLGV